MLLNAMIVLREVPAADMSEEKSITIIPFIILFCFTMFSAPLEIQAGGRHFLSNSYWDSGKAEFQTYNVNIEKYGYKVYLPCQDEGRVFGKKGQL